MKQHDPTVPHIIVVTHGNRLKVLKRTIPAVLETEHPFTLTVVTNGVTPSVMAWLKKQDGIDRIMVNKKNMGFAIAANQAWRSREDADYTVHLGDDCVPLETDWLRKLVDIVDCCPEVGIVGHSVEGSWPLRQVGRGRCLRTVQVQPSNIGGVLLFPRRTTELLGYYNEEMGQYGEEDALYGWKVRTSGLLCAYFDHNVLGRSFEHLGSVYDTPDYRAKKDKFRAQAIPIRDAIIAEYKAKKRPIKE